jgi:MoaA/NifB/PqqE/SkfB family radical SAM enzyme
MSVSARDELDVSTMARLFPRHLNIETSDHCNRACVFCPIQHTRAASPPRLLDLALFEALLEELAAAPHPLKISLQWIDEPLTNPRFFDYAELGRARVPGAQWLLQTNADFLNQAHVDRLSTIFDAISINLYSESAAHAFAKKNLVLKRADARGLVMPGRLSSSGEGSGALWHVNEKFRDHDWVERFDEVSVPFELACHRLHVQAAIAWNGDVHLCCRDNEKRHVAGNLAHMTLYEAYNGPVATTLRRAMEDGRRDRIAMCASCPGEYKDRVDVIDAATHRRLVARRSPRSNAFDVSSDARPMRHLPFGTYDYETARGYARARGHVVLPGILSHRYEVIVGLLPEEARALVDEASRVLGDALVGLIVCGSRVMTRERLFLVDPSVFKGYAGTLEIGQKGKLREYGKHPRRSSDLDLKVLVDEARIDAQEAARLSRALAIALEPLVTRIPLSGHVRPELGIHRVPSSCEDARAAFLHYNARRLETVCKGPLSLEYSQVLFDRAASRQPLDDDPTAVVQAALAPRNAAAEVVVRDDDKSALDVPTVDDDDVFWRARVGPLSWHQLVVALVDFPALAPSEGALASPRDRVLALAACRAAGRLTVPPALVWGPGANAERS